MSSELKRTHSFPSRGRWLRSDADLVRRRTHASGGGPSDILFLQALSAALKERGRTGLDTRWTICPAGGIDKIMPFVSLFAGKRLHVAVLSDEARGEKGKVEKIRRSDILRTGHFFTVADFIEASEGDIEDIFHPEIYAGDRESQLPAVGIPARLG